MSKKKKFKLSAQQKAQFLSQVQLRETANSQKTVNQVNQPDKPEFSPVQDLVSSQVKFEIKRIGLILGLLVIFLAIVAFVDSRQNYSLTLGQRISSILGL